MDKRQFIINVIVVWIVALAAVLGAHLAHADPHPPYVFMALQQGVDGEGNAIYTLIKDAQEVEVSAGVGTVFAMQGAYELVVFQVREIKPEAMSLQEAAQWLSQADGFVSFDFSVIAYYASINKAITNRAFTCQAVYLALPMKWWQPDGQGGIEQIDGTVSEWITAGAPVFAKMGSMPVRMGVLNQ